MQPPDRCSLDKQRREPCCCYQGVIWILAQQAASFGECVCVRQRKRGRQRLTAFLEMPFHWSKHHSNIVPPMTREQPVVLRDVKLHGGVSGGSTRVGWDWFGEKSGVCFGLRLQNRIEMPLHVQPVVFIRAMHTLSLTQQQMLLLQLTGLFFV